MCKASFSLYFEDHIENMKPLQLILPSLYDYIFLPIMKPSGWLSKVAENVGQFSTQIKKIFLCALLHQVSAPGKCTTTQHERARDFGTFLLKLSVLCFCHSVIVRCCVLLHKKDFMNQKIT